MLSRWLMPLVLLGCGDLDGDGRSGRADCNDADPTVNKKAPEICDGVDNDCDGLIDEDVAIVAYLDRDGDGYGDTDQARRVCTLPDNGSLEGGDCDDDAAGIHPGAVEICDGIDNDCTGGIDDGVTGSFYADLDGDGSGSGPLVPTEQCWPPAGFSADDRDCDDGDPTRAPTLPEACDGVDNDCNGTIDDGLPIVQTFADADQDGSGDPSTAIDACGPSGGRVLDDRDCDDSDPGVGAFALDVAGNGIDEDCDGYVDELGIPSQFPDIELALAASQPGDVVQFEDGTHFVNVDLLGYDVTLAGNGCAHTTLFGAYDGSVVVMDAGSVENLTVAGGSGTLWPWDQSSLTRFGGGIFVPRGQARVRDVCFEDNGASGAGGAIAVLRGGQLTVEDSRFEGNNARRTGGAIFGERADLDIRRSHFVENESASFRGGAVGIQGGTLWASNSVFAYNRCEDGGGAVSIDPVGQDQLSGLGPFREESGSAVLSHVTVHASDTTVSGHAALYNEGGDLRVEHSVITDSTDYVYYARNYSRIDTGEEVVPHVSFVNVGLLHADAEEVFPPDWILSARRGDPAYVDAGAADLRLLPSSPFRDQGPDRDPDGSWGDLGAWGGPDALPGGQDVDLDQDGMADLLEVHHGLDPQRDDSTEDPDGDGATNLEELAAGADPHAFDTDGDGVSDGEELQGTTRPGEVRDQRPQADAGLDRRTLVDQVVPLDGSHSFDPNGDALTYVWTVVESPAGASFMAPAPGAQSSFSASTPGEYRVTLTVDDGLASTEHSIAIEVLEGIEVDSTQALFDAVAAGLHTNIALAPGHYENVFLDVVGRDLTLFGRGDVVLDALPSHPHLRMVGPGVLQLSDLTLANGRQDGTIGNDGGSLDLVDVQETTLERVTIEGAYAADKGGAIYAENPSSLPTGTPTPTLTLRDVRIVGADAHDGAALRTLYTQVIASNLAFVGNRVHDRNGFTGTGIVYMDGVSVHSGLWNDVQFVDNEALSLVLLFGAIDLELRHGLWFDNRAYRAVEHLGLTGASSDLEGLEIVFEQNRFMALNGDPSAPIGGRNYNTSLVEVQVADVERLINAAYFEDLTVRSRADLRPGLYVRDGVYDDLLWGRLGSSVHDAGWMGQLDVDGSRSDHGLRPRLPRDARWSLDADADGMSDGWEVALGLDPLTNDAAADLDGDGLTNLQEHTLGTDPRRLDTDLDGISDLDESNDPDVDPLDPFDNRPVASIAPPPGTLVEGTPVVLDGSGSIDPNGSALSYHWAVLERPVDSQITQADLVPIDGAAPMFVPDARGTYRFELVVDDGTLDSLPAEVSFFVFGTLNVPGTYTTEEAFSSVLNGETIAFGPGEYVLPSVTLDGSLTVRGTPDTVLRAAPGEPHFLVEPSGSLVLEDLTLTRGSGRFGGSVQCDRGVFSATRVRFVGNVSVYGGALNATQCPTVLEDVDFVDNQALEHGGAILVSNDPFTWTGGRAVGNVSGNRGGAIHASLSIRPLARIVLDNVVLADNEAVNGGAGYFDRATSQFGHLTVSSNRAPNDKGGLIFLDSNVAIRNSILERNLGPQITILHTIPLFATQLSQVIAWRPELPSAWFSATTEPGPTVSAVDPRVHALDDLRLEFDSPGIDAGSGTDPDGSPADLGAWGGTAALPGGDAYYEDTDGDGLPDAWEVRWGFDPLGSLDGAADPDADLVPNLLELQSGTNPTLADSDDDGTTDREELDTGFDPADWRDHKPLAFAGFDVVVAPGTPVTLDGQYSTDPNSESLTYLWSLANAPLRSARTSADIQPQNAAMATFTPDVPGAYVFELVVNDAHTDSFPARIVVRATGGILVPEDYPTLAEAVDAVASGGTIGIGPGAWDLVDADLQGKDIQLFGAGSDLTRIDASHSGTILRGTAGEQVHLEGLTLSSGFGVRGAGLEIVGVNSTLPSGPRGRLELVDVAFEDHIAVGGAALYAEDADVTMLGVRLTGNHTSDVGGAMALDRGTLDAHDVLWAGNASHRGDGGALHVNRSTATVQNAVFADNTAVRGGGIATDGFSTHSTLELSFITAVNNQVVDRSGFLHLKYSSGSSLSHGLLVGNGNFAINADTNVLHELDVDYTWFFDNALGPFPTDLLLSETALSLADPGLVFTADGDWTNDDWHLPALAPALDSGDASLGLLDLDGSPLDPGAYGGPLPATF